MDPHAPASASSPRGLGRPVQPLVIGGFLGPQTVDRLLGFVSRNGLALSEAGVGNRQLDPAVRRASRLGGAGDLWPGLEERFAGVLDAAVAGLRLQPFVLDHLELQLLAHRDGGFYKRHVDVQSAPDRPTLRVLTGVYYFHRRPKGFSGGELRLFALLPPEQGGTFVDVEPACDTLVLFPAWVPHEVRPVHCPSGQLMDARFSINCWFHARRPTPRPAAAGPD